MLRACPPWSGCGHVPWPRACSACSGHGGGIRQTDLRPFARGHNASRPPRARHDNGPGPTNLRKENLNDTAILRLPQCCAAFTEMGSQPFGNARPVATNWRGQSGRCHQRSQTNSQDHPVNHRAHPNTAPPDYTGTFPTQSAHRLKIVPNGCERWVRTGRLPQRKPMF